jgi:hypothetical protein
MHIMSTLITNDKRHETTPITPCLSRCRGP